MKIRIIFTFAILFILMSCTENKAQQADSPAVEFSLTDCGGTYNDKPLPFGKPIEEWEKLFGKPTRKIYNAVFIWDNLGVIIDNKATTKDDPYSTDYEIRKHDQLHIFFSNLESPAGQKGKLKFAHNRISAEFLIDEYKKGNPEALTKELEQEFKDNAKMGGPEGPDKYIYPYTTYSKPILVDGAIIAPGMSLKGLNKNRKEKSLDIFSFRDNNLDGINEWGDTDEADGEYWNNKIRPLCGTHTLSVVQFSDHELEFIKVEYYDDKESDGK